MIPSFPGRKRGKTTTFGPPALQSISPARRVAHDVLAAVDSGGYASDLLRSATAHLDVRDAGLAGQIVFGVLRFQAQLDFLIEHFSGRSPAHMHAALRIILRSALFQLRYLERIPHHAAVHESVELAKYYRRAASGLVNAVLRKVNRDPVAWPNRAVELSCPTWLLETWTKHFGGETAEAIAAAALEQPVPHVRIPPGTEPPPDWRVEPTPIPGAWRLLEAPSRAVRLHDIGSQTVLPALGITPDSRYLDLCAAPGNKTRQALESHPRLAVACDISETRLHTIGRICPRLVLDGTERLPFAPASFDRIFIDAPCSGTGTIGRNPEIKWRVQPSDFSEFANRQRLLIQNAATILRPDGSILYATCSLQREENESVVAEACRESQLHILQEHWRLPGRDPGDGFYSALLAPKP